VSVGAIHSVRFFRNYNNKTRNCTSCNVHRQCVSRENRVAARFAIGNDVRVRFPWTESATGHGDVLVRRLSEKSTSYAFAFGLQVPIPCCRRTLSRDRWLRRHGRDRPPMSDRTMHDDAVHRLVVPSPVTDATVSPAGQRRPRTREFIVSTDVSRSTTSKYVSPSIPVRKHAYVFYAAGVVHRFRSIPTRLADDSGKRTFIYLSIYLYAILYSVRN